MNLTKLKALQICKELWTWMRDTKATNGYQKAGWQGWEIYMESHCPCCEYASQNSLSCDDCLLPSFRDEGDDVSCRFCMNESSPYFSFAHGRGTPADAQRIIDGCDEEIEKLKKARKEEAK